MRNLLTVTSLLLSTALLLVGHGMQMTLLPLRASSNGMSDFLIGLTASGYYLGFVIGCLTIPYLIARVGHIRCFAVLSAVMVSVILSLDLLPGWLPWLVLRFSTGMAIAGLYTVIESWLNSQAPAKSRGQILAVYTFIVLTAMAAGQFMINIGPIESSSPFILAALFMALAIIPVGMTRRMAPTIVSPSRASFILLYRRSRTAFAGTLISGLVAGSFWALGAIFARRYSESQSDITWFITAVIIGGALMQYPAGWLSDKIDRRKVMIGLVAGMGLTSAAVALTPSHPLHLLTLFLFGGMLMPIYAISLATVADVSAPEEFVEIGTSVLLLNAMGSVVAPLIIGQLMSYTDVTALFWSFAGLSLVFIPYLFAQSRHERNIANRDPVPFAAAGTEAAPAGFDLDPRGVDQNTRVDPQEPEAGRD